MKRAAVRHSFFLVMFCFGIAVLLRPSLARAATLFVSPSGGTYAVGQTVTALVKVNTEGKAINSAEGTVTFSKDTLHLEGVSKAGSIFQFWTTEPAGANASGRVVFSGGLPSPGYKGSNGTIIRVTFTVRAEGKGTLTVTGGQVLANDGLGTNILTSQGSASYTLQAAPAKNTNAGGKKPEEPAEPGKPTPAVTSTSHSDENLWYREQVVQLAWSTQRSRQAVSYSMTQDADTTPDEVPDADGGGTTIMLPTEGVWYFHIRAQYDNGWSTSRHFRLQYDATPPPPFSIQAERDRGATDPTPVLVFAPTDALSGIARITIQLDGAEAYEATSPATLSITASGEHRVRMVAYDRAGNSAESTASFSVEGYPAPLITSVSTPVILLEQFVIAGTAQVGDTVTVYLNDDVLGAVEVPAGSEEGAATSDRSPWLLRSDRVLRPGVYRVTATAKNDLGQESVRTDPHELRIAGHHVLIGGWPMATIAVAPIVGITLLIIVVLAGLLFLRVLFAWLRMHQRVAAVDRAIQALRIKMLKGKTNMSTVEETLEDIEENVLRHKPPRRSRRRSP